MYYLGIKPLSLNQAYRGRRFSTPALDNFKAKISYKLPPLHLDFTKPMAIALEFGVSSANSDGDNLIKCTQDAIANCYGFNDKLIFKWQVEKKKVDKGKEYILFDLENIAC